MKRLCYGTFARALELCSPKSVTQLKLHKCLISPIDPASATAGKEQASRLFNCGQDFDKSVTDCARYADKQEIVNYFDKTVLPLIDPNKVKNAILALWDVILNDTNIKDDTVIDELNHMTKQDLSSKTEYVTAEFLANIYLYAVAYVPNRDGENGIKEIDAAYIAGFDALRGSITLTKRKNDYLNEFGVDMAFVLPKEIDENELLEEVNNKCPIEGCGLPLRPMHNGRTRKHYGFLRIRGQSNGTAISSSDYIALCKEHYEKFNGNGATKAEWEELRRIKARNQSRREAHNRLFNIDLYKEVKQLLINFDNKRRAEKPPADYDVVDIKDKFYDTDSLLFEDIVNYVAFYFKLLNTVIMDYERECTGFYRDSLRVQIKDAYRKIRDGGFAQEEIYWKITVWLIEQTGADETICRIVVAYFVQLCDVFDPIKKEPVEKNPEGNQ